MDYAGYVRGITFRLLQPERPRPEGFRALDRLARKSGLNLEMWMTVLPEEQEVMQRRLRPHWRLKGRSTFAIGAIINRAVADLASDQMYLAIGVERGFPLLAGMAGNRKKHCLGLEGHFRSPEVREMFLTRFERRRRPEHDFREGSFRDYLSGRHDGVIGFCSCTGLRTFEDQFDALRMAEPFFAAGALILIHEANRIAIRRGLEAFLSGSATRYRSLLDVRTPRSGHPTFGNGVVLLQQGAETAAAAVENQKRAA